MDRSEGLRLSFAKNGRDLGAAYDLKARGRGATFGLALFDYPKVDLNPGMLEVTQKGIPGLSLPWDT